MSDEQARQKALKPDREKLERFVKVLLSCECTPLRTAEANAALCRFQIAYDDLITDLKSDIENL